MKERILFIEDDQDDVFLLQRACKSAGIFEAEFVSNGKEAVDCLSNILEADQKGPMLLFLDLNMPLMNGFEFLNWIRGRPLFTHVPVLVLTSSENPRDVRAAYDSGASAYLVKPTSLSAFTEMLGCAVHFWIKCNRLPAR